MPGRLRYGDIEMHVSTSSLRRGTTYYRRGAVTDVTVDGLTIRGQVRGSQFRPYQTTIVLDEDGIIKDECSCPLGGYCKHVVALSLAALNDLTEARNGELILEGIIQPAWEKSISSILSQGQDLQESSTQELYKLQLALRETKYQGKTSIALRPRAFDPVTGRSGFNKVSWPSLHTMQYQSFDQHNLSSDQTFFLWQLASALGANYSQQGWLDVASDRLQTVWQILSQAPQYDVPILYDAQPDRFVRISDQPIKRTFVLEETKQGNAALRVELLTPDLNGGHESLVSNDVTLLGDPPQVALTQITDTNEFLLSDIQDDAKSLPNINKEIIIPKHAIKSFQARYAHQLAADYGLKASPDTISIPILGVPRAAIHISTLKAKEPTIKVRLGWQYEKKYLPLNHTQEEISRHKQMIIPDRDKESELKEIMATQFVDMIEPWDEQGDLSSSFKLSGMSAANFMENHIATLMSRQDFDITKTAAVPDFKPDDSDPEISFNVLENTDDQDWFDLNIVVTISGENVPFADLFTALHEDLDSFVLPSGRYFPLKNGAFDELRQLITESHNIRDQLSDTLKLSRYQIDYWAELEKLGLTHQQAKDWRTHVRRMSRAFSTSYQPPRQLKATLRDYQLAGYSWLRFLYKNKLGGLLADDMGLGKTVQMIALIVSQSKPKSGQFLVIAPTSVVETWQEELEKFAPHLKYIIMRSGDRSHLFKQIHDSDVVITSYALLRRDFKKLSKLEFDAVILDEAQAAKNYQSQVSSLIRQLPTKMRFAMTGTPMENSTMELWSLFSIVAPGLFGDPRNFREHFQKPIEQEQNQAKLQQLRSRIRPFMMRRTKETVEQELPPKTIQTLLLDMPAKHKHVYDLRLQLERKKVLGLLSDGGLQNHRFEILKSITRLRQMALHPGLVNDSHKDLPNAKLDELVRHIREITAEGHKALIFSQFTSFLKYVRAGMERHSIPYLYLDGSTKKRGDLVKRFQSQSGPENIFIISLKAGGSGLNLTAADYCYILDPWWNPAVEMQAIDRTHRIGQDKHVHVYKMISKETIEEKVLKLQLKKQKLFDNVMNNTGNFSGGITEEDIRMILA